MDLRILDSINTQNFGIEKDKIAILYKLFDQILLIRRFIYDYRYNIVEADAEIGQLVVTVTLNDITAIKDLCYKLSNNNRLCIGRNSYDLTYTVQGQLLTIFITKSLE